MSGRTRKRVIIAGVALLVCGVIARLVQQPSRDLTLTLLGCETNQSGIVQTKVLLSNASLFECFFYLGHKFPSGVSAQPGIHPNFSPEHLGILDPHKGVVLVIEAPPSRVIAVAGRQYSSALVQLARRMIDPRPKYYTLEIPE